jgi:DNA-directed RNA polymerase specialized sigma24 family protein
MCWVSFMCSKRRTEEIRTRGRSSLGNRYQWTRGSASTTGRARDFADTDDLAEDTLFQTFKRIEQFEPC